MRRLTVLAVHVFCTVGISAAYAQSSKYPPLADYLMPHDAEVGWRGVRLQPISRAGQRSKYSQSGYAIDREGDNGFICMVMRGWSAPTYTPEQFRDLVYDPTVRAPICFDPSAARVVMPYYELRSKLAMQGYTPERIAQRVEAAYARGELPRRDGVTFAYMWSADQHLASGIGHWHPHMMVFSPYYKNGMLGENQFGAPLPQVTDDVGTPFAVVVIPVDDKLAIKAAMNQTRSK